MDKGLRLLVAGLLSALWGYIFTVAYLSLMWKYSDPAVGVPFFWFIPHGVKGLHFHHDIEFFIAAPVCIYLSRKGFIPAYAAYVITAFFFGMALHHWHTEGLRVITVDT